MNKWEKRSIILFALIIIFGIGLIAYQNYFFHTVKKSAEGGTFIEGILVKPETNSDEDIASLTNVGLTRLDAKGAIAPSLAQSWTISEDGKTYTFKIKKGYATADIIKIIKQQKGGWSDIDVSPQGKDELKFVLRKPYGQFLASTLRPIFPYGPYEVNLQDKKEVALVPRANAVNKPFIQKIVFRYYYDQKTLEKDLLQGKISATAENISLKSNSLIKYPVATPRYYSAFFNTSKAPLSDKANRDRLISNTKAPSPYKIVLLRPNTEHAARFAEELTNRWKPLGVTVEERVSETTLITQEAAKNQYDVVIYGYNAGYYDDPYPFWHSSQALPTGMNFSHYSDLDTDTLIEEGRLTRDDNLRREKFNKVKEAVNSQSLAISKGPEEFTFTAGKQIKGIKMKYLVLPSDRFTFADIWYIKTRRVQK